MTNSISPFQINSPISHQTGKTQITRSQPKEEAALNSSSIKDSIDISSEALQRQNEQTKKPEETDFSWEKDTFGFKNGEFTLKNGNRQVVHIDGAKLSIEEYKGDNLVRKVDGTLTSDGALLQTQFFDKNGKVSQNITTEFSGISTGESSGAIVKRSAQWFDDGKLIRTMDDSIKLESSYNDPNKKSPSSILDYGTQKLSNDFESLVKKPTSDSHKTEYKADIIEYHDGIKSREAHIKQRGSFYLSTNRSGKKVDGMEPYSTTELKQNSSIEMNIINYDKNGKVQHEATWNDSYMNAKDDPNGSLSQSINVSWYNDGKIVKHEHSSVKIEETKSSALPKRPEMLEILGISNSSYSSKSTPQTASQLLAEPLLVSSTKPGFYNNNIKKHVAKGDYKTADIVARDRISDRPYDMKWSSEIYKEGELVAKQEDTESARKNELERGLEFWNGRGLTEGESPATIKSSSHTDQSFEDGRLKNDASIKINEQVDINPHGPDKISTHVHGSQKAGLNSKQLNQTIMGEIKDADTDLHAASKRISKSEDILMGDIYNILDPLDDNTPTPERNEYRFRLVSNY